MDAESIDLVFNDVISTGIPNYPIHESEIETGIVAYPTVLEEGFRVIGR